MKFLILFLLFSAPISHTANKTICSSYFEQLSFIGDGAIQAPSKFDYKTLPTRIIEVGKPIGKVKDLPFGNFKIEGKVFKYTEIKSEAKRTASTVYFGKPFESEEQTLKGIRSFFERGKSLSTKNTHRDILKHQMGYSPTLNQGKGNVFSGFAQTTEDFKTAERFASKNETSRFEKIPINFGVVYVIDTEGAETLKPSVLTGEYWYEEEVLFDSVIAPERIKGAILMDIAPTGEATNHRFIPNPNYKAQ